MDKILDLNKVFRFKQFSIQQDGAPFKIGTDGLLLGAWATQTHPKRILDIGTGTGLIALMLAQKYSGSKIDAIEINAQAAQIASKNFSSSPWFNSISLIKGNVLEHLFNDLYDLIVCNPPFFYNSKLSGNVHKDIARHTVLLSFEELILKSKLLLKPSGVLCLITPFNSTKLITELAQKQKLFISKICTVKPTPSSKTKRTLFEFCFKNQEIETNKLIIESNGRHQYSKEYIELVSPFLLDKYLKASTS